MPGSAASSLSPARPATSIPGGRILTLDALRGVAVMGILLINILGYALPDAAYFSPVAYGDGRPADIATWAFNFILVDGKMRNLFSLLFGASMLLVIERARAGGVSAAGVHFARMLWLLVFGLVHFYFIWSGDILSQYAALGLVAWFFRTLRVRTLLLLGLTFLAVQLLITTAFGLWLFPLREAAYAPGAGPAAIHTWIEWGALYGQDNPLVVARELAIYRGESYFGLVGYRFDRLLLSPLYALAAGGLETFGMMLLGMAGLKSGFLTAGWSRAAYWRVVRLGYGIGLPVMIALAGWCAWSGFDPLVCFTAITGPSGLVRPLIVAAHVSLLMLWLMRGLSPLTLRVAAVGRAAFTNYLGGSILMSILFNGYGFGLFGHVGRAELYLIVLAVWALMLLWSKPWLDRFRYGPLEWLWRSLARGRAPPLRRLEAESDAGYQAPGQEQGGTG